jgi:D-3-phosphoglycerate dehydrogenase
MRVLFADAVDPSIVGDLRERGHDCDIDAAVTAEELPGRVAGVEVLVVRSTRVTAETIAAARDLELIVRAGAGTNTIDVQAAADVGVYVTNVPGRNAIAVAELTMGLLLAIDRRIPDNVAELRAGRWDKATFAEADGLFGKRLGIVGLGGIGLAVAERAAAFGLDVAGIRKDRPPEVDERIRAIGIELVDSLEALVETSDIVSIHVPAAPETTGLFDAALLGRLRPGAILLNTSRGDIVDEAALLDAIEERGLRVGLDVYPEEPAASTAAWSSKLAQHPNVVGTHHIGASTEQAQRAVADGVVEIVEAFVRGEVLHCVNLAPRGLGTHSLHIRHVDRIGVLAGVFETLRRRGLNVEHMENRIFQGGAAAVATIEVAGDIDAALVESLEGLPDVIHVSAVPIQRTSPQ